jgi:hypothetical protein
MDKKNIIKLWNIINEHIQSNNLIIYQKQIYNYFLNLINNFDFNNGSIKKNKKIILKQIFIYIKNLNLKSNNIGNGNDNKILYKNEDLKQQRMNELEIKLQNRQKDYNQKREIPNIDFTANNINIEPIQNIDELIQKEHENRKNELSQNTKMNKEEVISWLNGETNDKPLNITPININKKTPKKIKFMEEIDIINNEKNEKINENIDEKIELTNKINELVSERNYDIYETNKKEPEIDIDICSNEKNKIDSLDILISGNNGEKREESISIYSSNEEKSINIFDQYYVSKLLNKFIKTNTMENFKTTTNKDIFIYIIKESLKDNITPKYKRINDYIIHYKLINKIVNEYEIYEEINK